MKKLIITLLLCTGMSIAAGKNCIGVLINDKCYPSLTACLEIALGKEEQNKCKEKFCPHGTITAGKCATSRNECINILKKNNCNNLEKRLNSAGFSSWCEYSLKECRNNLKK
jgi:hypothetical protein